MKAVVRSQELEDLGREEGANAQATRHSIDDFPLKCPSERDALNIERCHASARRFEQAWLHTAHLALLKYRKPKTDLTLSAGIERCRCNDCKGVQFVTLRRAGLASAGQTHARVDTLRYTSGVLCEVVHETN